MSDLASREFGPESLAIWQRFHPVQDNTEDFQTYRSFQAFGGDSLPKRIRFLSLAQLVRQIAARKVAGAFAECGCFYGHSTHTIARTMTLCGLDRQLLVFDSFEGLSAPTPEDLAVSPNHIDILTQQAVLRAGKEKLFAADLQSTMRNLAEHKFIVYNPGWIPETFAGLEDERFAFVHIDVDLYQPARDSLEFFYPRLSPGGIIQIDDYNIMDWPGCNKATDEFIAAAKPSFFFQLALSGAFLIK